LLLALELQGVRQTVWIRGQHWTLVAPDRCQINDVQSGWDAGSTARHGNEETTLIVADSHGQVVLWSVDEVVSHIGGVGSTGFGIVERERWFWNKLGFSILAFICTLLHVHAKFRLFPGKFSFFREILKRIFKKSKIK
jgi:hypothetical protein